MIESYADIPRAIRDSGYMVHVSWESLESHLAHEMNQRGSARLELEPDFQRGHVWSREQQVAYVEAKLRGAVFNDMIRCNCVGWQGDFRGPFVLVDGLQRITAARLFLSGELKAFGRTVKELGPRVPSHVQFLWTVNSLSSRKDVLNWYLQLNSTGVRHPDEELERVKRLVALEA